MHHKLPYKKPAYGKSITVLFFFFGHSMESLSAINLYSQLMTLMFFVSSSNDFHVLLEFFSNKQLPISYLHSSE